MAAQYDPIADRYQRTKASPLRRYVEQYTLMLMAGDIRGARVLDLGCGDGSYAREFRRAGAASVVGVDVSASMLDLARAAELADPLGIEYVLADAAELPNLGQFDLVAAAYLLHYADDVAALSRMTCHIANALSSDGRLIALNENPHQSADRFSGYDQYGFNKIAEPPLADGDAIAYWFVAGRETFKLDIRFFAAQTYERALRAAGLANIAWRQMELDPDGVTEQGDQYWREYLDNPPIVGLECRREPC